MKPFTKQLYSPTGSTYTIRISGHTDYIDQKRDLVTIKPGQKILINVMPRLVQTSEDFNALRLDQRKCKLPYEIDGLELTTKYSRVGCETECAIQKAMAVCRCIPWHYPYNFDKWPMCEMFGSYCFDVLMSADTNYWECKYQCLKDCQDIEYIVIHSTFPIDTKEACRETSFLNQHFQRRFHQHFAFYAYQTMIQGGSISEVGTSLTNGSLCQQFVKDHVSFVSVKSPMSLVLLTERDKAVSFYDILGTIGGTFGLFTGMSLLSFAEIAILILILPFVFVTKVFQRIKDGNHFAEKNLNDRIYRLESSIYVSDCFISSIGIIQSHLYRNFFTLLLF